MAGYLLANPEVPKEGGNFVFNSVLCPDREKSVLHRTFVSVFLPGPKALGGIRRVLHVCLLLAFHSEIQAFFVRLGHKIIFFFHSSSDKKFGFLLSLKSKVTAVKDIFPMTSALHLSEVVEVCSLLP